MWSIATDWHTIFICDHVFNTNMGGKAYTQLSHASHTRARAGAECKQSLPLLKPQARTGSLLTLDGSPGKQVCLWQLLIYSTYLTKSYP